MDLQYPLHVTSDAVFEVVVKVDYAECEDQEIILPAVAHQAPILAANEIGDVVDCKATPLKHN